MKQADDDARQILPSGWQATTTGPDLPSLELHLRHLLEILTVLASSSQLGLGTNEDSARLAVRVRELIIWVRALRRFRGLETPSASGPATSHESAAITSDSRQPCHGFGVPAETHLVESVIVVGTARSLHTQDVVGADFVSRVEAIARAPLGLSIPWGTETADKTRHYEVDRILDLLAVPAAHPRHLHGLAFVADRLRSGAWRERLWLYAGVIDKPQLSVRGPSEGAPLAAAAANPDSTLLSLRAVSQWLYAEATWAGRHCLAVPGLTWRDTVTQLATMATTIRENASAPPAVREVVSLPELLRRASRLDDLQELALLVKAVENAEVAESAVRAASPWTGPLAALWLETRSESSPHDADQSLQTRVRTPGPPALPPGAEPYKRGTSRSPAALRGAC